MTEELGRIELDAMRETCGIEVQPYKKGWTVLSPIPETTYFKTEAKANLFADELAMELVNAGFVGDMDLAAADGIGSAETTTI